jgi:hypothetical protein
LLHALLQLCGVLELQQSCNRGGSYAALLQL